MGSVLKFYAASIGLIVTALGVQANEVTLAWDRNLETNLQVYILHSQQTGVSQTNQLLIPTNNTTTTVSNLAPGNYTFTLTAKNILGLESLPSNPVTVSIANQAPIISAIADQAMVANTTLAGIAFTVGDSDSSASTLTLSGTSSKPSLLPNANIAFGGSGSNRTVTLTPVPGQQGQATVTVSVSDGQASAQDSFVLTVQPALPAQSTLTVLTQGSGSITPALNGQLLTVGHSYTLTAVPADGSIFTGWTGGATSSSPSLHFLMTSNLVLQAGFMTNPFTPVAGLYNGLFYEDTAVAPDSAGFLTLKTTGKGAYSGKVLLGAKRLPIVGQLDFSGRATNHIIRKGTNTLTLEFHLSGVSNTVSGRLGDGVWDATVLGDRAGYSKTNPAPFSGRFTVMIPGTSDPADGPEGQSIGTIKIDTAGVATFAGALADGSKVSQKVPLSRAGAWPLYTPLYKGTGLLLSWQSVSNRPTEDINGLLCWVRRAQPTSKFWPAGFSNELVSTGSRYVPPAPSTRVVDLPQTEITFSGGNLTGSITNDITLDTHNKILSTGAPLSLSFSLGSGLFSGKVTDPLTGKPGSFRGVVLQKQVGGAGYLLGTNRSAQVSFGW